MSLFRSFDQKNTVVSYGIICYNRADKLKYLLIQQKFSYAFMTIIRGFYSNIDEIMTIIRELNNSEVILFKTKTFCELWELATYKPTYRSNFKLAEAKFRNICLGSKSTKTNVIINFYDILNFVKNTNPLLEWGFPKGRQEKGESPKSASIREFSEETNLSSKKIRFHDKISYREEFIGTNGKKYIYFYYIAEYCDDLPEVGKNMNEFQTVEINDIKWNSYDEAITMLKSKQKKNILEEIDKIINLRKIYSYKKQKYDDIVRDKKFGIIMDCDSFPHQPDYTFIKCPICEIKIKVKIHEDLSSYCFPPPSSSSSSLD